MGGLPKIAEEVEDSVSLLVITCFGRSIFAFSVKDRLTMVSAFYVLPREAPEYILGFGKAEMYEI